MRNLLEYLNLCLEFINEKPSEGLINNLLVNIQGSINKMTIEEIEGFELAFEALDLFYQRQINSIDMLHASLKDISVSDDIEEVFADRYANLDGYAQRLTSIVYFMGRVSDIINIRRNEILGTQDETIVLK